jgi:molybdate transport system substrate-binding protein
MPVLADEIVVSAAVSLKEAFGAIARRFEQENPGHRVVFNYGASGDLARQIALGAPVDVFAAAALKQMHDLDGEGRVVRDTVHLFAGNRLVVVIPKGGRKVAELAQLASLKRIALGNPKTVPAGEYAAEALQWAALYQRLAAEGRLVFAENVRQVLAYVESGNVDAGIVYATDARTSRQSTLAFAVPAEASAPIVYPIAVVAASRQAKLARAFVAFVLGPLGQAELAARGFLPPPTR